MPKLHEIEYLPDDEIKRTSNPGEGSHFVALFSLTDAPIGSFVGDELITESSSKQILILYNLPTDAIYRLIPAPYDEKTGEKLGNEMVRLIENPDQRKLFIDAIIDAWNDKRSMAE
jgi:hypothetical protein